MSKAIRNGFRIGTIFGIIIIFLGLIGFTEIVPKLIGKFTGNTTDLSQQTNLLYFIIFIIVIGLWNGWLGAKLYPGEQDTLVRSSIAGISAGLVPGLLSAVYAWIIGTINQAGIDMRGYLVGESPENITLFLFYLEPISGSLIHFAIFTLSGLIGGVCSMVIGRAGWRKNFNKYIGTSLNQTVRSPQVAQFFRNKYMQYIFLLIVAAILFFVPRQWGSYWNYVMGTVGVYVLLGIGLNIIIGWSGQLVLGYVAFFAIGAYTFALLTAPVPHDIQMNFWLALILGTIAAAISGILLGLPILNLRGDYLAIVTLGFGEIVRIMIKSDILTPLTGGPKGVRNISGPTLFGNSFSSDVDFMYLIIIAVLVTTFLAKRIEHSRSGRSWMAIREDETVARATGINTFSSKLLALALGAAIAGLAGGIFASRNQFTGPEDHALMVSINVLCLVIVGGMGNIPGMFLGAFALKGLPELLREVESYRMLMFGALLVVMMIILPEGLLPATRPKLENVTSDQSSLNLTE